MLDDAAEIARLLAAPEPITWVFAGDSITQGASHTLGWRDYTELFGERVRFEMSRRSDVVIKTAVSGWRIQDVDASVKRTLLQWRPNVVSLAVGMNDCVAGESGLAAFQATYEAVIARVRGEVAAAVIMHTPPRILPLDEPRWSNLPAYVQAVRDVSRATNAVLVDHHAHWTTAVDVDALPYWLSDAIHPNEHGHRAMSHLVFKRLGMWDGASPVCRLFVPRIVVDESSTNEC